MIDLLDAITARQSSRVRSLLVGSSRAAAALALQHLQEQFQDEPHLNWEATTRVVLEANQASGGTAQKLLESACHADCVSVVRACLASGARINPPFPESHFSVDRFPVCIAAHGDRVDLLAYLLEQGADIEARDGRGDTALSAAVSGTSCDCFDLLIRAGANPGTLYRGQTPLLHHLVDTIAYRNQVGDGYRMATQLIDVGHRLDDELRRDDEHPTSVAQRIGNIHLTQAWVEPLRAHEQSVVMHANTAAILTGGPRARF